MALVGALAQAAELQTDAARRMMVGSIRQLAAAGALGAPRSLDAAVLRAVGKVPRHAFVPGAVRGRAYADTALEIGHGATISQPFMVAVMTDLAEVRPGEKVLEVGTGSGYQAAILSELGARVYTVEIVPELAAGAASRLKELGYGTVQVRAGDGYAGWREQAPFDAIVVTAGATHVPPALLDQLAPGGRLVIPVGRGADRQQLTVISKDATGKATTRRLGAVMFIPLAEGGRARR